MKSIQYISFLRAINVGGHVVKMERLRALFSELGLTKVGSYIQTGNLFFETSETDRPALTATIEQHLERALGYPVTTMLRTPEEVETALARAPFAQVEITSTVRLCIMFLAQPLPDTLQLPFISAKQDFKILLATPGEVYIVLHIIDGRYSNAAAYIEKTFGIQGTVRFFATTAKILAAAQAGLA